MFTWLRLRADVRLVRRVLVVSPMAAWALLFALWFSFLGASESCGPGPLWTSGWFFVPPALALLGFLGRPFIASALASGLALGAWSLFLFLWFFAALGCSGA
jgi:hypothetical protein